MKNMHSHPKKRQYLIRASLGAAVAALFVIAIGALDRPLRAQTAPLLVQPSDLHYQGAFQVPLGATLAYLNGYAFGGGMLTFNPARNSLFMGGYNGGLGEVSIPAPVNSATLTNLPVAAVLQPLTDPSEGKSATYDGTANSTVMVYNGQLIGAVSTYYDANYLQVLSHYVRPIDLSVTGQVRGLYQLGSFGPGTGGRVSGWMTPIPGEWRSALGGSALAGQCCIPIITRTSWGPSAFAFNPADLGAINPAPATPLLYYPNEHPWGPMERTDPVWNGSTMIGGMVLPNGTRSLLYFGSHGVGDFCYGLGGGLPADPSKDQCYDPENSSKGMHGYPYVNQVTAYDVMDLAAVKRGEKNSWDLKPYAVWQLAFPISSPVHRIAGATYDPATQRLFVTEALVGGQYLPLVHVFTIGGVGPTLTVPSPPRNVRIMK